MMYKREVTRWVAPVIGYLRCESPILQVWDENAIPISLSRYSDCPKRGRWNSLPNGAPENAIPIPLGRCSDCPKRGR